jgi:hypothetical protein
MTDKQQLHDLGNLDIKLQKGKHQDVNLWQFEQRKTAVRVAWC